MYYLAGTRGVLNEYFNAWNVANHSTLLDIFLILLQYENKK